MKGKGHWKEDGIRKRSQQGKKAQANAKAAGKDVGTPKRRLAGLSGALICWRCKQLKPATAFHRDRSRANGRHTRCAACHTIMQRLRKRKRALERKKAEEVPIFVDGPLGPLQLPGRKLPGEE